MLGLMGFSFKTDFEFSQEAKVFLIINCSNFKAKFKTNQTFFKVIQH